MYYSSHQSYRYSTCSYSCYLFETISYMSTCQHMCTRSFGTAVCHMRVPVTVQVPGMMKYNGHSYKYLWGRLEGNGYESSWNVTQPISCSSFLVPGRLNGWNGITEKDNEGDICRRTIPCFALVVSRIHLTEAMASCSFTSRAAISVIALDCRRY